MGKEKEKDGFNSTLVQLKVVLINVYFIFRQFQFYLSSIKSVR